MRKASPKKASAVRSYGISGIVVFNASRFVEAGDVVSLDFVPERPLARLTDLLQARAAFLERRNGSVPDGSRSIARVLRSRSGARDHTLCDSELRRCVGERSTTARSRPYASLMKR